MAEVPRSSFIPKQAKTAVSSRVQKKRRFNVLGFISMTLLLASLVLAGGTYLYKDYTQKQLTQEKQALADARGKFNESDIASVRELDARFRAANYLLSNHLAPSKIFDALETTTNQNVQFKNFSFSQLTSGDVSVTVDGATDAFKSVALQALAFGQNALFKDAVFTKLSNNAQTNLNGTDSNAPAPSQQNPEISFNVTGSISPALIAYGGQGSDVGSESTSQTSESNSTSSDTGVGTSTESSASTSVNTSN
jgi:hypothetical protein